MKQITLLLASILIGHQLAAQAIAVSNPPENSPLVAQPARSPRKIQIAILFDTSNSMDGLIEQAKSTIWQIVNAAGTLRHDGGIPQLEIALYDYGNTGITTLNHIRKQVDLIGDLDSISEKLFSLSTNGGDEYCGAVIKSSLEELKWSSDPRDLRLIYIAGNEPFNQGSIDYKDVLKMAVQNHVVVNTIYCGPYQKGVEEFWFDGSKIGGGTYFNIDSNKEIAYINTPYDAKINSYNDSLNGTYYGYGVKGELKKSKQAKEDNNARSKGAGNNVERAVSKSSANYSNKEWDIVDAAQDGVDVGKMEEAQLPKELQGKTESEKKEFIDKKTKERAKYQKEIGELAVEREKYIAEERKKKAETKPDADLGSSVIKSMEESAIANGFVKEVKP